MNQRNMTAINSSRSVPETLADLRTLFGRYGIEDWEPIPGESDRSYAVRYLQAGQWMTVSSILQPSKAQNLRQCHQVISYLFLWASRGVAGVSQGVTFIHGGLATTEGHQTGDSIAEAYAIIGVDVDASMEEIQGVYHTKIKHSHPDHARDPEEQKIREERTVRLNQAFDAIEKSRQGPGVN